MTPPVIPCRGNMFTDPLPGNEGGCTTERELLYDWRLTANQFVLAPAP
jgi:hypothetical protein